MKILSNTIKKLPDTEQIVGKVTGIHSGGTILVLGNQGQRVQAVNDSNQDLVAGDFVTVVLSSPPSIIGKTLFKRGPRKTVFV